MARDSFTLNRNQNHGCYMETVREWQSRPLDPLYPIVYLDRIVLKIRHNQRVINKSMYLALGVNMEGHRVRNSLKLVPYGDYKAVTADLKTIYQAPSEEEAKACLEAFSEKWDNKY